YNRYEANIVIIKILIIYAFINFDVLLPLSTISLKIKIIHKVSIPKNTVTIMYVTLFEKKKLIIIEIKITSIIANIKLFCLNQVNINSTPIIENFHIF
ncbi:TPA: hypothetical protein ACSKK9_002863, partial [Listeria innocua]